MARSFLSVGVSLQEERLGALAIFSRGTDQRFGHVGFVVGRHRGDWLILGGNQNNQVSIAIYEDHRLLGLRWPQSVFDQETKSTTPASDFSRALAHILRVEGGWFDHPLDRGGPTNYGITLATYARFKKRRLTPQSKGTLTRALRAISRDEVKAIYRQFYWDEAHCASMNSGIALMHFDAAVNHGVHRALRFLQTALHVEVDGIFGPQTKQALRRSNPVELIYAYSALREGFYKKLKTFPSFGRGWLNRLTATTQTALKWARQTPRTTPLQELNSKEKEISIMSDTPKWWGESLTIWGTIVTALATVVPALAPLFGFDITADMVEQFGQNVSNILQAIGGVIGTIMAIYGRLRVRQPLMRRPIQLTL